MCSKPASFRPAFLAALLALAAFALLAARFSPNWVAFAACVREATLDATTPAKSAAIEQAILSGFSERGLHVVRQTRDLSTGIEDSNHKIVRWRLLFPALGHVLGLSGWTTLGLAHVGCLVWIAALVAIGRTHGLQACRPAHEAACLAVVAGSSAPFFASMGLLGYYDSWLVLALLAVAFAPMRWLVIAACLLGPWIDERFVIGLPLALLVRWFMADDGKRLLRSWLVAEAALPLALAVAYGLVRLKLGGSGSSQTVSEYFRQFVLNPTVSVANRLFGAWSGLRLGWVLVIAAIVLVGLAARPHRPLRAALLTVAVGVTALVGLFTALDLSRSMALLTPVIPFGWVLASRTTVWQRFPVAAVLAALALLVPAYQVMGRFYLPVDNIWKPSLPLLTAQNNVGMIYDTGKGVPKDEARAVDWYRRAAEKGHGESQNNLGAKYTLGHGVATDLNEALKWYRLAAAQGEVTAQYNLGVMYAEGTGVPKDPVEAVKWYRMAAERGFDRAQNNLGAMYMDGAGVPKSTPEAIKWYARAALKGMGAAATNLGVIYFEGAGISADPIQAYHWFLLGAGLGDPRAKDLLPRIESRLNADQIAAGRQLLARTLDEQKRRK